MNSTQTLGLNEDQIARDAAAFARRLQSADVHRADQEQAAKARRAEQQVAFDEKGLPRGLRSLRSL